MFFARASCVASLQVVGRAGTRARIANCDRPATQLRRAVMGKEMEEKLAKTVAGSAEPVRARAVVKMGV